MKTLVDRFLSWKLPLTFSPDAGISFKNVFGQPWPVGTNLLTATEAEEMIEHIVGDEFNHAFRRGVHAAVQAIVSDLSDLVARRRAAHSPQQMTEVIVAMARRIAERPYPTEDPGPSPSDPEVPAEPRPTTEMLLSVACLAAEESGLPVQITVTSDGLQVLGRDSARGRSSVRAVSWQQFLQSDVPMLSLAVEAVVEELRG